MTCNVTIMPNNIFFFFRKFNNMTPARILRQHIPRPKVIPKYGQSTERYIIIDSSQKSFKVPDTDCNFSFLLFLNGSRKVKLVPAEECQQHCKSLNINLLESHLCKHKLRFYYLFKIQAQWI